MHQLNSSCTFFISCVDLYPSMSRGPLPCDRGRHLFKGTACISVPAPPPPPLLLSISGPCEAGRVETASICFSCHLSIKWIREEQRHRCFLMRPVPLHEDGCLGDAYLNCSFSNSDSGYKDTDKHESYVFAFLSRL